ncbi:glycosyltransferase family 4 protein, partial [bacterium]|nr:glycosyltransferase family 4 protein [bacterium]
GESETDDKVGLVRLHEVCPNVHVMKINKRPTWSSIQEFRQILKSFDPDVVETFKAGAQYHSLYGGIGHNRHILTFYRGISRQMDYWQELKYRLKRVDVVVPNCQALHDIICKSGRVDPEKVKVIYDEIDPVCSNPDAVDATGLRAELNIPEDKLLITNLGNYSEWRGQDITLRAVKLLKDNGFDFHLLFCGKETELLHPLVSELKLEDSVTLSPYRRDPQRVLKITDILVNSSTGNESLSGALLNSQAMGIPAVASRMPGFDESVGDQETGILFPVGDAKALADSLSFFINMTDDDRSTWGSRAHKRAINMFSSKARVRRRLEVYQWAMDR